MNKFDRDLARAFLVLSGILVGLSLGFSDSHPTTAGVGILVSFAVAVFTAPLAFRED